MDISSKMVEIATKKYSKFKNIKFSTKYPTGKYEYVFMCDVIEHLENPEATFREVVRLMDTESLFVNTMANPLWEPLLMIWEKLGLKMKEGPHKRISYYTLKKIMLKSGLVITHHDYELLIPVNIPFVTGIANKLLGRVFRKLCFIEYVIAKKKI